MTLNSIHRSVNDIHMMVNLVYTCTTLPPCFCHQPSHYNSVTSLIEAGKQIWKPLSLSLQLLGYTPYQTDGLSSSIGMERYPRSRTPISSSKTLAVHLIPGLTTYKKKIHCDLCWNMQRLPRRQRGVLF